MSRGRRRSGSAAVLAVLLLAAVAVAGPAPAGAAPSPSPSGSPGAPVSDLAVRIDQLLPVSPHPGDALTVTGTVANRSDAPLDSIAVRLRVSPAPLAGRSDIGRVLSGEDDSVGDRVPNTRVDIAAVLRPGQAAPYSLTLSVDTLGLGRAGVYVVGVEALGAKDGASPERRGISRTFLPWIPDPTVVTPGGVVMLWPLTEAPAVDADGVLLTPGLARAVGTAGRLRVLLDTGGAAPGVVSWVVDPATLETVASMTSGYRELVDGEVQAGSPQGVADATAWLAAARTALSAADVTSLPYAVPDDSALVRGGLSRDVLRATTTAAAGSAAVLGRPVGRALAWPADMLVTPDALAVLGDTGAGGVLLSDQQLHPEGDVTFTPTGSAPLPAFAGTGRAVVADSGLSAALVMRQRTRAEITAARQRFVAELAMVELELPSTPRTVVAAPPLRWSPSGVFARELVETVAALTWTRPATLTSLLAAPPSSVPRVLGEYPSAAQQAELAPGYVSRLRRTEEQAAALSSVVGQTSPRTSGLLGALQRSGSIWWRSSRRTGEALLARTAAVIATESAKVRIVTRGSVNLPGESGVIPVTIANDLAVPVTVGLSATGDPAVRFTAEPVTPVTIAPGRKASIEMQARVVGSGPVTAVLQLTTTAGAAYGAPVRLQVGSAAYARAAAWVVGAAFGVLVLLVLVNGVRRIRSARAARTGPALPDGTMAL